MDKHCFCSHAVVENDKIKFVETVIDKKATLQQFHEKLVVVGDGNNDAEMISCADIGIGFGGVREIAPAVLHCCTHAIYDEEKLVKFLSTLKGAEK